MKKILVIAAHPDDETLGVGGTIMKHRAACDQVTVLILTDGVTARHNEIALQQNAAIKACKLMDVNEIKFGGLPDQQLDHLPLLEVIDSINRVVKEIKPDIIYTHHGGDVNQDHRIVFEASLVVIRPVTSNTVKEVFSYEIASSTEWAPPIVNWIFKPNVYVDISPFIERKIDTMLEYAKVYQTEVPPYPHPRSPEAIRVYATRRGIEVGMESAEAFMLLRRLL